MRDRVIQLSGNFYDIRMNTQSGRVYDPSGISPTLDTKGGGNREVKIAISYEAI